MPTAEVKDPACPCQRCASAPLVCLLASVVTAARERRADPASRIGTAFSCFDLRRWAAYRPADDRGREPQPADDRGRNVTLATGITGIAIRMKDVRVGGGLEPATTNLD